MSYLKDHIGSFCKFTATIYLYKTCEYVRFKDRLCLLAEECVHDSSTNMDTYLSSLGDIDAATYGAISCKGESPSFRRKLFLCLFLIDGQITKLLFTESDFSIVND